MFQVPAMHDDPSHVVAEDLTRVEPFAGAMAGWHRPQPVLRPAEYARLLFGAGFPDPRVRMVIYPHVLASRDEVVEWMKGTLLTDYVGRLPAELRDPFVDAYRARLLPLLDAARPFFFPFTRILCWGRLC
jgi:trans-aconitate 2-methyltransferase